jgi:hypothetical protein
MNKQNLKVNLSLISLLFLMGCATIDPSADPFVVYAESTLKTSLSSVDKFEQFAKNNELILLIKAPQVIKVADQIRDKFPSNYRMAWTMLGQYKANKTPEAKLNVSGALNLVDQLMVLAEQQLATGIKIEGVK